ncbi:hypothetical protein VSS37_06010 [Candidatus Thiothrix sp. Deng01]|uniref:Uncharacterized protein n=1 Tax=Candidatus Thiothrix phosphatis TaxID=3112415 RepID=A0ABU6CWR8_9GAMM|nr:hypothetical protein [Candidatus Thiothrix sp. Deng01]MEB4590527.1 hypothetical protein [Candidatus Thiothrix sp. Deng01]
MESTTQELFKVRQEIAGLRLMVRATYRQTQPKMHWIVSATVAAVVAIPALVIGLQHLPQEAQDAIDTGLDWTANQVVVAGRMWADYTGNIDRSYSLPNGDLTLIGLTDVQSCRWRYAVRKAESSGYYAHPGNQYGYFAGYGFGAEALSIVGLVKRSAFKSAPYAVRSGKDQKAWLDDAGNWTLAGGKAAFLNNQHLQDVAVSALANENIKDGFSNRVLSQTKPEQVAGFAAAAHLKGLTAAISWYLRGKDSHDANGTNTSTYAAMGEASISKQVPECGDGGAVQPPGFWSRLLRTSTTAHE